MYVDASDDVRVARMAERDGVSADADHPDQRRYLDAQRIYLTRCRPRERRTSSSTTPTRHSRDRANHPARVALGAE